MKSSYAYVRGVQLPYGAGPNDPAMVFGPAEFATPELVTFFAPAPIIGVSIYRFSQTRYLWQVQWLDPNTGPNDPNVAFGSAYNGVITVIWNVSAANGILNFGPGFGGPVPFIDFAGQLNISGVVDFTNAFHVLNGATGTIDAGGVLNVAGTTNVSGAMHVQSGGTEFIDGGGALNVNGTLSINPANGAITAGGNQDILVDGGLSLGRGLVGRTSDNSTTFSTGTGTGEADLSTLHVTANFKNGRAYRVEIHGYLDSSTQQGVSFRAHVGTAAGTTAGFFGVFHIQIVGTTIANGMDGHIFIRNVSGSDLSRTIVPTFNLLVAGTAAEFKVPGAGLGSNELCLEITDVGPAASYPKAFAIT